MLLILFDDHHQLLNFQAKHLLLGGLLFNPMQLISLGLKFFLQDLNFVQEGLYLNLLAGKELPGLDLAFAGGGELGLSRLGG